MKLSDKYTLTRNDLSLINPYLINPSTGKPFSKDMIRKVFQGTANNNFIKSVLTKYFEQLRKTDFPELIKISVKEALAEINTQN